jgi:hypothetical protein
MQTLLFQNLMENYQQVPNSHLSHKLIKKVEY